MLPKPNKSKNDPSLPHAGGEEKTRKPVNPVLLSVVLAVLIAGVVTAASGFIAYQSQVVEVRQQQLDALAQQQAELAADNLASYLRGVTQQVSQFSRKPTLAAALAANSESMLERQAGALKARLEGTEAVQFFAAGSASLQPDAEPPVRFSELELIGLAEEREPALPEFSRVGERWLLTLAAPLPAEEALPVIGTMLVRIDAEIANEELRRSGGDLGRLQLVQDIPGVPATNIFTVGQGGLNPEKQAAVAGSHWRVEFEPGAALRAQTYADATLVYIGTGVVGAVLLIIALLAGRRVGERIRNKLEQADQPAAGSASEGAAPQQDILDIEIADEDEALLGLEDEKEIEARQAADLELQEPEAGQEDNPDLPAVIFRAYDIRGKAREQITNEVAQKVGQAVASEALDAGETSLFVARDARLTSPELTEYLVRGILSTGCNVINIGTVPTPLLYFATATQSSSSSGVMVTASHNPKDDNGFKIVIDGKSRSENDIRAIRSRILSRNLHEGAGEETHMDIVPEYIDTIFSDVALAGEVSIVVDAANGVTGKVAPRLFEELGCAVTPLFCDLDGNFPNHEPDTSVEANLRSLIGKVKEVHADLGVAFDGDGDRMVVVTPKGKIIWPDRLLMLFAKDIVSRNPGADVVFDVKSTRALNQCITDYGGRPILWKTGHSPMKSKMAETGALLGGEYSGHIFIKDRWYGFDDGMYAAARLIEIISLQGESIDDILSEFPELISTPEIRVNVPEDRKFKIIDALIEKGDFGGAKINTLDGLRADFKDGWGLVRASNTSASLTMRFEAETEEFLHQLKALFVRELRKVDKNINVEWNH